VAPKAAAYALPCACISLLYHFMLNQWGLSPSFEDVASGDTVLLSLFTSILGFLVVFRAQLAYGRYWEGITLVEQACGVWLNGVSNLVAFCSVAPEKKESVREFQYMISRLASLLVCESMSDISKMDPSQFSHLSMDGFELSSLEYLETSPARMNTVLQWMQRLVVENLRSGVLDIAPPILTRVFQEFSIGYVHFIDANKLTTIPFPFEFAQAVLVMLTFFSFGPLPLVSALTLDPAKAFISSFLVTFVFWAVHHIAVEIELPYGNDPNDLPLGEINDRFNRILLSLLDRKAQNIPRLARECEDFTEFAHMQSLTYKSTERADPEVPLGRLAPCPEDEYSLPIGSESQEVSAVNFESERPSPRSRSPRVAVPSSPCSKSPRALPPSVVAGTRDLHLNERPQRKAACAKCMQAPAFDELGPDAPTRAPAPSPHVPAALRDPGDDREYEAAVLQGRLPRVTFQHARF